MAVRQGCKEVNSISTPLGKSGTTEVSLQYILCIIVYSYTTNDKRLALQLPPNAIPASVATKSDLTQKILPLCLSLEELAFILRKPNLLCWEM